MSEAVPSADEVRHRLYEIMKEDQPFEERAQRVLELGTDYLDVDTGFLTRINPATDSWETIISTDGEDGLVPAGMKTDLDGTYCRYTLERDSPLAIHDAPADERIEEASGMHCYHGVTLTVDGEVFGTVCFVAADPREEPFDEADTMFAELIGRLLEHELEHRAHTEELERKTNLVNVLDRVLRHNIRNDLTVIRANAEIHAEKHAESTEAETILSKADELIETSETARRLGRIINNEFEAQPLDVVDLARNVLADAAETYPATTFELHGPDDLSVTALPSLTTALDELVENAAEYAGDSPTVAIRITDAEDCVEISVVDDGPGIPQSEQDALQAGTETSLVHGSGLGLWAVYWAVLTHHGELDIETGDGTTVTMTIPHGENLPATAGPATTDEDGFSGRIAGTEQHVDRQIPRAVDRYEALFENASIGMLMCDDDGLVLDRNDRARSLLGEESTLRGRSFHELRADDAAAGDPLPPAGTVTVDQGSGETATHEFVVSKDVLPGQHLVVFPE